MEFIKRIQQKLGLNDRQMGLRMGLNDANYYVALKKATVKIGIPNIVRLYRISGMTADDFMRELEGECKLILGGEEHYKEFLRNLERGL